MAPPGPVFDSVVREFGPGVVAPDGSLDRRRLAAIVFSDPAALRHLDQLVHPATSCYIRQLIQASGSAVVAVEAIKLIEAGTYRACDEIWVVTCTREQQTERLVIGRGLSAADAERRVAAQSPASEKTRYATVVIDASGTLADTRRQVLAAWRRFVAAKSQPRA